jgi:hypothetical protein
MVDATYGYNNVGKKSSEQDVVIIMAARAGSTPALSTMSKRYSESSNQDLKNDSAECLRREWDIMGYRMLHTFSQ